MRATPNFRIVLIVWGQRQFQREPTMTEASSPATSAQRRSAAVTTTTVVSFSLTLLGGAILVLAGLIPLPGASLADRVDVGAVLLAAPVMALVLAVVVETTRIALTRPNLPEPRRRQVLRWAPSRRAG